MLVGLGAGTQSEPTNLHPFAGVHILGSNAAQYELGGVVGTGLDVGLAVGLAVGLGVVVTPGLGVFVTPGLGVFVAAGLRVGVGIDVTGFGTQR